LEEIKILIMHNYRIFSNFPNIRNYVESQDFANYRKIYNRKLVYNLYEILSNGVFAMPAEEKHMPLQPIRRYMEKGIGTKEIRISAEAVEGLRNILENLIVRISSLAKMLAEADKRKTIKKEDIERAFTQYFLKP